MQLYEMKCKTIENYFEKVLLLSKIGNIDNNEEKSILERFYGMVI